MFKLEVSFDTVLKELDNIDIKSNYDNVTYNLNIGNPQYTEYIIRYFKGDYPNDSDLISRLKIEVRYSYLLEYEEYIDLHELIDLLYITKIFSNQLNIGIGFNSALDKVISLIHHNPWTPLTGEDDEWIDFSGEADPPSDTHTYQNKRCPSVFKYVTNGVVRYEDLSNQEYILPNGKIFVDHDDIKIIEEFPYIPVKKPIYLYNRES